MEHFRMISLEILNQIKVGEKETMRSYHGMVVVEKTANAIKITKAKEKSPEDNFWAIKTGTDGNVSVDDYAYMLKKFQ